MRNIQKQLCGIAVMLFGLIITTANNPTKNVLFCKSEGVCLRKWDVFV